MCPYNSFVHGMIQLFKTDIEIRRYIENSTHPYFENLTRMMMENDVEERQKIWFQFLRPQVVQETNSSNYSMAMDMSDTLDELFHNFQSCVLQHNCTNCLNVRDDPYKYLNVSFPSDDLRDLKVRILERILIGHNCRPCGTGEYVNTTTTFQDLVFIRISHTIYEHHFSSTFDQIPESFENNQEHYDFKFLVDYRPARNIGHFICYTRIDGDIWELNDVGMSEKVIWAKKVNPVVMVYVKRRLGQSN